MRPRSSRLSLRRFFFGKTIARKLQLAFFSIFIITYLATALVVQSAVRTAMTDSELATLSQLARLKLNNLNARFEQLSTDLRAWAKLDVMNDLASGDVDKRVENTLANLEKDYAIKGHLYAFNAAGLLVASSDRQHKLALLPDAWKSHGQISFVNKHTNPFDGGDIVALIAPIAATFSANYQLGTIVMAYHWSEINAALSDQTMLLYHQDLSTPPESAPNIPATNKPLSNLAHQESLILLESTLGISVPKESLPDLAHREGWMQIGKNQYLVNSASENTGLLSGWQVVVFRDPESLHHTLSTVTVKLAVLCAILALPLTLAISWLARLLSAPLRELTQFVSGITETQDLSKRLTLRSNDELGVLTTAFNNMTTRLESASKHQKQLVDELKVFAEELENKVRDRTGELMSLNSELTRALEDLKATQSQLIHHEKMASLGQLVAGVAHELNNPIGFIYANYPHLEEYVSTLFNLLDALRHLPLPADSQQQMEAMYAKADIEFLREDLLSIIRGGKSGTARIREIISSLRSFSHLGEAEVKMASLEDGINETLALLQYQLKTRIEVVRNYHLNAPVLCRPGQLNQVFMNILSNAIQAIDGKGTITINTRREDNWAIVEFSDTGCGIPPDVMNHIFDPFFTTKQVGEGTGLGLSISHSIIEDHGGRIEVKSEVGRGTTLTLYIPCDGGQFSI